VSTKELDSEEIFNNAAEIEDLAERAAYLDDVCGDNQELRADVESLLKSEGDAGDFLEAPVLKGDVTLEDSAATEGPGSIIGRYKLLERIGEGGMAVVYMAEQAEPIRRKVAMKIIKLGMDTRSVIARFEAERQALAMMAHPNIARVLDAGATETGRPYFVMELVHGISITEYCDQENLPMPDRLELFTQVCNAVQHAHQRGIIHRDLKPSNIMVTMHDDQAVPKVIDFGIAKAVNQRLTEKTLFTRYGHMIGTPAYMSPEQAQMSGLDIDTRSDIYSLGVLLYELLTGTAPFADEELHQAAYLEMQRIIREEEPVKPSTKLSTLGATLTEIAKKRCSTPEMLRKTIRGDLDWIVMKALEKNRTRRYPTASEFTADIRRHLGNEPVLAGPPSTLYRMKKFVQRRRALVAATAAVVVALVAGSVISTSLYLRMRRALVTVSRLEEKAEVDSKLSTVQRLYAEGRYQGALDEIEAILAAQDLGPKAHLMRAQLLVEVGQLEDAEAQLLPLTKAEPEIAGAAYYILARVNVGVDPAKASEYEARAGSLLPDTAEAYSLRAMTAPNPEKALQWLDRAITLDPGHYPSRKARALIYYALGEDQKMMGDIVALIALRPKDFMGYALRAIWQRESGQYREAIADHTRALELCEDRTELCELHHQRYNTYTAMGDHASALADAQSCAELDPQSRTHRMNIFKSLLELKDFVAAKREYRSIVQTNPLWEFRFSQGMAEYVFDRLSTGEALTIPPGMLQQAPFAQMQRMAECYHTFASKAQPFVLQRQVFILWGCSPDGEELLCGWRGRYGGVTGAIQRSAPSVAARGTGLKIVDVESGEERLVTSAYRGSAAWSPDGKYIAFSDPNRHICIVPAQGGETRKLAYGLSPRWSRDSHLLYFSTKLGSGDVCFVSIEDPEPAPQRLMRCSGRFVINEDENWIAFARSTGIRIVDLSSGALLHQFRSPWPLNMWGVSLSRDGRELCFRTWWSSTNIGPLIFDMQEKQLYRVLDYPIDSLFRSQDGSRLIVSARPKAWSMDVDPNLPICQILGQRMPGNDLITDQIQRESQAIAADPVYPDNYLERAMAYTSLGHSQKAESDLRQFDSLVTQYDHHVGHRIFMWIREYYNNGLCEAAELLTPHAEKLMDRFPEDIPSYRDLIEQIIAWGERENKPKIAARWKAKLEEIGENKE